MRTVKTNNILFCFIVLCTTIYSCKNVSKPIGRDEKSFLREEVCDINGDNKKDIIRFQAFKQKDKSTFDFHISIKYSFNNQYKTKKIKFKDSPNAIFWGVKTINNSIRIGYSDEALCEFVYYINYNHEDDNFYLEKRLESSSRDTIKFNYDSTLDDDENIDGRSGFVELDAMSVCRIDIRSVIIKEYLDVDYDIFEKKCIKIPYDDTGRAIAEAEIILGVQLEQIDKN